MDFFKKLRELSHGELRSLASLCAGMALLALVAVVLSGSVPLPGPLRVALQNINGSSNAAATALGIQQGVPGYSATAWYPPAAGGYPARLRCYINYSYYSYGTDDSLSTADFCGTYGDSPYQGPYPISGYSNPNALFGTFPGQVDTFVAGVLSADLGMGRGVSGYQTRTYTTGGNYSHYDGTGCPSGDTVQYTAYASYLDPNTGNTNYCYTYGCYTSSGSGDSNATGAPASCQYYDSSGGLVTAYSGPTANCPAGSTMQDSDPDTIYTGVNRGGPGCYDPLTATPTLSNSSATLTRGAAQVFSGEPFALEWSCLPSREVDWEAKSGQGIFSQGSWGGAPINYNTPAGFAGYKYTFATGSSGTGSGFSPSGLTGSQSFPNGITTNTTYGLTCTGGTGAISVPITVVPFSPITANPTSVAPGGNSTISWSVQNIDPGSCSVTGPSSPPPIYQATTPAAPAGWSLRINSSQNKQWHAVGSDSTGTKLVAGAYSGGQIYTSVDGGATWNVQPSSPIGNWGGSIASSADGTHLTAVSLGAYIYTSADSGATWTHTSPAANWWGGVASSQDGSHLAATNYGGYIYTSTDSGATWTARFTPANWTGIASDSTGNKLVAGNYGGYIYTSTNGGVTWTARSTPANWTGIASDSTGNKLVAGNYGGHIYTSTDSGATWTAQPQSGMNYWWSVTSSADGSRLAAGSLTSSLTSYVYVSSDGGATWSAQSDAGNGSWTSIASSADGTKLVAADNVGLGLWAYTDYSAYKSVSGTYSATNITLPQTYTMTCTANGKSYSNSATVSVTPLCSAASGGGATGTFPTCTCNTSGYIYNSGTNSCTAPLCSAASGGGATGTFPSCTCNTSGWVYTSGTNSCTAPDITVPTVTTSAASSITASSAQLNGSITATGGANATVRGFAYGTVSTLATVIATTTEPGSFSTGSFSSTTPGLSANTTYYFRPYATNSAGTGYGSIMSFTTGTGVPTVLTSNATSLSSSGGTLNGSVTATGGANPTDHGFQYSTNATLSSGISTTSLGAFTTGSFFYALTSLAPNTTYYFRAYATNSAGVSYGSILNFATSVAPPTCSISSISTPVGDGSASSFANVSFTSTNVPTSAFFQYGTNSSFPSTIPSGISINPASNPGASFAPSSPDPTALFTNTNTTQTSVYLTLDVVNSAGASTCVGTTFVQVPAFSFAVSSQGNKSVAAGNSVNNTITVTRSLGVAAAVSLSYSVAGGTPVGFSATFTPTSCTPSNSCTSTMAISTTASTPLATYGVTVTGTSGATTKQTTFNVMVTTAPFTYTLTASPPADVVPGASTQSTIGVTVP